MQPKSSFRRLPALPRCKILFDVCCQALASSENGHCKLTLAGNPPSCHHAEREDRKAPSRTGFHPRPERRIRIATNFTLRWLGFEDLSWWKTQTLRRGACAHRRRPAGTLGKSQKRERSDRSCQNRQKIRSHQKWPWKTQPGRSRTHRCCATGTLGQVEKTEKQVTKSFWFWTSSASPSEKQGRFFARLLLLLAALTLFSACTTHTDMYGHRHSTLPKWLAPDVDSQDRDFYYGTFLHGSE